MRGPLEDAIRVFESTGGSGGARERAPPRRSDDVLARRGNAGDGRSRASRGLRSRGGRPHAGSRDSAEHAHGCASWPVAGRGDGGARRRVRSTRPGEDAPRDDRPRHASRHRCHARRLRDAAGMLISRCRPPCPRAQGRRHWRRSQRTSRFWRATQRRRNAGCSRELETLEEIGDWGHYVSVVPPYVEALVMQGRGTGARGAVEVAAR